MIAPVMQMKNIYFDENGCLIEDQNYTPPPGSYIYSTRCGDFVFPMEGRLVTVTSEDPDPAAQPDE